MCRLSGPNRLEEDGPDAAGSEVRAPRLKGCEWSKAETAMDARVLAPEHKVMTNQRRWLTEQTLALIKRIRTYKQF